VAFADDAHVDAQRAVYRARLERMAALLGDIGIDAELPAGGFYLWVAAPGGDAWGLTRELAEKAGMLVSPGEFYGAAGAGRVRIALVQPDAQLDLVAARLGRRSAVG
jgi:aspartate/methionine/tyrosine aminotransferase